MEVKRVFDRPVVLFYLLTSDMGWSKATQSPPSFSPGAKEEYCSWSRGEGEKGGRVTGSSAVLMPGTLSDPFIRLSSAKI